MEEDRTGQVCGRWRGLGACRDPGRCQGWRAHSHCTARETDDGAAATAALISETPTVELGALGPAKPRIF
jgi:hypothetical protein